MIMFKAALILCNFYNPANCIEIRDTRGPYPEEEMCVARVYELFEDVRKQWPLLQAHVGYRCSEVEGT